MSRAPKNKKALSRIFADNSKSKILAIVPEVSHLTVLGCMQAEALAHHAGCSSGSAMHSDTNELVVRCS